MIKYASALKTGTADADALRRFTRSNLQHPTYQGLYELGRVIKTIFLLIQLSLALVNTLLLQEVLAEGRRESDVVSPGDRALQRWICAELQHEKPAPCVHKGQVFWAGRRIDYIST
jgi:TnpA family transposase